MFFRLISLLLACPLTVLSAAPYCLLTDASCFPSASCLAAFNASVSGRLETVQPYGRVCYSGTYVGAACEELVANKTSFAFRESIPAAMMFVNTEFDENDDGCPVPNADPTSPLTGKCSLGSLASYIVEVQSVQDVSRAVKFAAKYNLRLRIKNVSNS